MEKLPRKSRRTKNISREELLKQDKNDLVDKILQLEAHTTQLRNIISKNSSVDSKTVVQDRKRGFDFTKCHYRRVLLHVLYFGWNYQGLAVQEDSNQTIEHHLFSALVKSCLIEKREVSQYHRCGRTDKGVSSFGQVISITLRSKHPPNEQNLPHSISSELSYCKILNRILPHDIRAVAWMPIPNDNPEYSARFDCNKRQYKYYFPRSCLNIEAMRDACALIVGPHDYRHLCKMDVGNGVTEFRREIFSADIVPVEKEGDNPTTMYCLIIEGKAFLWHQIRCVVAVLLLIGEGKEEPAIMKELLDVEKNPRRPQYQMALDVPLNLFRCSYDLEETQPWIYDKEELKIVISQLQSDWTISSIKSTMIKDSIHELEKEYTKLCTSGTDKVDTSERDSVIEYTDCLLQGVKAKIYTPLLKRETCSSLEERVKYYKKKRKIGDVSEKI